MRLGLGKERVAGRHSASHLDKRIGKLQYLCHKNKYFPGGKFFLCQWCTLVQAATMQGKPQTKCRNIWMWRQCQVEATGRKFQNFKSFFRTPFSRRAEKGQTKKWMCMVKETRAFTDERIKWICAVLYHTVHWSPKDQQHWTESTHTRIETPCRIVRATWRLVPTNSCFGVNPLGKDPKRRNDAKSRHSTFKNA